MASALVQMTPFSPCSQLSDVLMIASEASLESFPGSREEGHKRSRSQSDGDEDQERFHVKKRRKQSKPIRITSVDSIVESGTSNRSNGQDNNGFDFSETGEHFLTERLGPVNLGSLPSTEQHNTHVQEPNQVFNDNLAKKAQPDNTFTSTVPLNLSSIKSSFIDTLDVSEIQNKNISLEKTQLQSCETSKTSTAQENAYLSHSPSLLLPIFKQSQIQNQISHISPQMRIFNPEAFCDLCNKEFCNKYFLKTHKANKHGIYSENQSGATLLDPIPSLPFTNYFSTNNESYENQQNFQTTSSSKHLTQFNQTNYTSNRSAPKKNHILQQPQSSLFSLKTNSSGNMRALCNICQREFCNKYFVRRHKLKIHGIVEPVSKESSLIDFSENSTMNNNSSQDKLDLPSCDAEIFSGYLKQFIPSNYNLDLRETSQTLDIKLENTKEKQERGSDCDTQVAQVSHSVSVPSENSSILHAIQNQNEENDKENNISSSGKFKKIGVVNADAFCDICCKEYCNKYFLRTHKLKSHGIVPIDDKKEEAINGANNMSWYQFQTTPLNLIVNETPSSNKEAHEKNFFDAEGEECVCNVCGRYFQSQFLLKMHQAYSHPNKCDIKDITPSTKFSSESVDTTKFKGVSNCDRTFEISSETFLPVVKSEFVKYSGSEETKENINADNLKKLQMLISRLNSSNNNESSMCDVCEKDVGHVSLLENHILKEHAMLLEELGNIVEEDNSNSQTSPTVPTFSFKRECPHCQKVFLKASLLEQHINDIHGSDKYLANTETAKETLDSKESRFKISPLSFAMQSTEDRQGIQTPTSSFCEICKKELCNKYFMKTHMQRMHGISIENGAQIGGVVCEICNKELCSKYFLRVHKQNSHGIVDEQFLPQIGLDFGRNQSPTTDAALKPTDQSDLSHRYFTHFNEVCSICNRRFRSTKWLKAHLWNDHGDEGKEKWREVLLQCSSEPKSNNFEESIKEITKGFELPNIYGNSSNQLSSIANTIEDEAEGKETELSGEIASINEKSSLNNSKSTFSILMNGKDSEVKHYQCSYCSFTTTILAFLFVHERSHVISSYQFSSDQPSQCPICFQNINSKEHMEKHFQLHNAHWQQTYPMTNTNQEVFKPSENKYKAKVDPIICTTPDTIGVASQDLMSLENVNSKSIEEVRSSNPNQNYQCDLSAESTLQCTRCRFSTSNVKMYLDHLNKEHPYLRMDQELPSYLQQMEKALTTMACNAGIPAVFAVPQVQDTVTMQPFVLEDSEYVSGLNNSIDARPGNTFLSSLVFLPVKKKLKKSVTASFKLTPT